MLVFWESNDPEPEWVFGISGHHGSFTGYLHDGRLATYGWKKPVIFSQKRIDMNMIVGPLGLVLLGGWTPFRLNRFRASAFVPRRPMLSTFGGIRAQPGTGVR